MAAIQTGMLPLTTPSSKCLSKGKKGNAREERFVERFDLKGISSRRDPADYL